MNGQDKMIAKKRGRPATGTNRTIGVRMPPELVTAIEAWRAEQRPIPSEPEAIRVLAARGLVAERYVELLDKSMNLIGKVVREEDRTQKLAIQVIEIIGTYKTLDSATKKLEVLLSENGQLPK